MSANNRPHIVVRELYTPPELRTYNAGGGGAYKRTQVTRHANKIFREAEILKQVITSASENLGVRKVHFRVELPDQINAWTTQGAKVEENIHAQIVGSPLPNVAHVSTSPQSFDLLFEQLGRYKTTDEHVGKSKFAALESISKIPFDEKVSHRLLGLMDGTEQLEVLFALFPDLLREDKAAYIEAITALMREGNGQLLSSTESDVGLLLKVKATPRLIRSAAEEFLGVYSVDPLNEVIVWQAVQGPLIEDAVQVLPNTSEAKACIFDSGVVSGSRFLDSSIIGREDPLGPPSSLDHGTFVSSRIIFGDQITEQAAGGQLAPDVKVLSVNLFTRDQSGRAKNPTEDEIVTVIRDTVERWHRQIKVFNLSVNIVTTSPNGTYIPVADDNVGILAAELDYLSRRFGVLFVVSAGNLTAQNRSTAYPNYFANADCRLLPPGEAMIALTVGSIAGKSIAGSMVAQNEPSPFTRRGPGFQDYRKPDLVANGGNLAATGAIFNDVAATGISPDGGCFSYGTGTSYAAPIVSRLGAHIFASIPDCSAELVRAILVHYADHTDTGILSEDALVDLLGNGMPRPEKLLVSDRWHQTFLYQGTINFREIQRVPFHVPNSLINRTIRDKVQVSYTVAFSPETARTLKSGYCKSHVSAKIMRIDSQSGQLKDVQAEDNLIRVNEKYGSLVRGTKRFSRNLNPGDWCLRLEHSSRWTLREQHLPFAAVITVSDPHRDTTVDIHAAVRAAAPNRYQTVLQNNLRVRI